MGARRRRLQRRVHVAGVCAAELRRAAEGGCARKDLSTKQDNLAEALFSGAALDPYVIFALNQEGSDGPKEGAIGLERAVDRAKSSTRWSRNAPREDKKKNAATWDPEKETFYLYVRDPADAQLALTVFDAEMTREDEVLGAASLKLSDALAFDRKSGEGKWSGWMPLTWGKQDTADNAQLMGAVARGGGRAARRRRRRICRRHGEEASDGRGEGRPSVPPAERRRRRSCRRRRRRRRRGRRLRRLRAREPGRPRARARASTGASWRGASARWAWWMPMRTSCAAS